MFHKGAAQMHGATDEELAEVTAIVGQTTFWSNVLHAQHYDIILLRTNSKRWEKSYRRSTRHCDWSFKDTKSFSNSLEPYSDSAEHSILFLQKLLALKYWQSKTRL
jgi:hypothetical protein